MSKSFAAGFSAAALIGLCLVLIGFIGTAHTADPSADQLAMEIGALKTRIALLESRTSATATPPSAATANATLAALQADVSAIKQVLQIGPSSVTLKTPGSLALQAGGQVSVEAGNAIKLRASASAELDATKIELKSQGPVALRGTTISLNNGSKPVAYQGAKTAGNATSQLITEGSATVLVP